MCSHLSANLYHGPGSIVFPGLLSIFFYPPPLCPLCHFQFFLCYNVTISLIRMRNDSYGHAQGLGQLECGCLVDNKVEKGY